MARRKSTRLSRVGKIEPSILSMTFQLSNPVQDPANPLTDLYYIDLSQCASLLNRRFYRQGLNWAVAGIKVISLDNGAVSVAKLPNTWVLANAWKKSMSIWNRMNSEALLESTSLRPRFLDFKVYANQFHHTAGYIGNQMPVSAQTVALPGEWESSKIFIPNATNAAAATTQDFEIIATGSSFPGIGASGLNALSMIEGYAASRLLPNVLDPNTPGDSDDTGGVTPENWMSAVFNEGNVQMSEVIEELTTENNIAPYPFENDGTAVDTMYPGGGNQLVGLEYHDTSNVTSTTVSGITRLKGGNFPCGLIQVSTKIAEGSGGMNVGLIIDMIPGSSRGYLTEPMQDM